MAERTTVMIIKADLQCPCCYKKVKKILCKFPQIRDQVYNEKANTVAITVVCCSPETIRDKICCKGGKVIESIRIVEPPKPKANEPEKAPKPESSDKPKTPPKASKPDPAPQQQPKAAKPSPVPYWCPPAYPTRYCCQQCYEGCPCGPFYHGCRKPVTLPPPPPSYCMCGCGGYGDCRRCPCGCGCYGHCRRCTCGCGGYGHCRRCTCGCGGYAHSPITFLF